VEDHIAILGRSAAVPPLEQVAHHHADLAPLAAQHLLQLPGVDRIGTLGPRVELQPPIAKEHALPPREIGGRKRDGYATAPDAPARAMTGALRRPQTARWSTQSRCPAAAMVGRLRRAQWINSAASARVVRRPAGCSTTRTAA